MSDKKIITRRAYSKVNLSLRIGGRREDGYHELDTLMVPVSLADGIEYANSKTTFLVSDAKDIPLDEENLVMKAVRAFERRYGRKVKQKITLRKAIPSGAGLGGGSSDAASTLLVLDEKMGTGYSREELEEMAGEVGSDVPFFFDSRPARCTGRGERVAPEPGLASWSCPVVIIKPPFGSSTADMYRRWETSRELPAFSYAPQRFRGVELVNDLERPAFGKFPFLGMLKNWLLGREGVGAALLTGSGSALFALTDDYVDAARVAAEARQEFGASLFTWVGEVNPPASS
ncbi:MAG: 4-(cytidine 5'-diphospho)-2-C-methyl-D-erythritol kinase [Akkermansiaceae bacterium]|nr:4-(cytidine 5'-diphospho)-2-C-methyl-D-erythritol kinase [Akkermansiaceae bacterium]